MQLTIIRLILIGNSIFFLTSIREVISCLGVFFYSHVLFLKME